MKKEKESLSEQKGHLHPLTIVTQDAVSIFGEMGFSVVLGPEIEDEWHNFDALNIPKDHPARDMQDTFFERECVAYSYISRSNSLYGK